MPPVSLLPPLPLPRPPVVGDDPSERWKADSVVSRSAVLSGLQQACFERSCELLHRHRRRCPIFFAVCVFCFCFLRKLARSVRVNIMHPSVNFDETSATKTDYSSFSSPQDLGTCCSRLEGEKKAKPTNNCRTFHQARAHSPNTQEAETRAPETPCAAQPCVACI